MENLARFPLASMDRDASLRCVKRVIDVFSSENQAAMRIFSFRKLLFIPVFVFFLIGVFSSFYTVNTESVGVVTRFGRYHDTRPPGLHFKLPYSIDRVTIVPTLRQLKLEFGFSTRGATNEFQNSQQPELERNMVTGDLNAAEVEWVVQYGISEPAKYLFHVHEPEATLRDISESCMNEVIGDRAVDEVLTYGRSEIESDCLKKLQTTMEQFNMGIRIEQIQLKNVHPPRAVQNSFDEVNRAQQEREERINIANGEYNKVIPKAKGLAEQMISSAEGYALQRTNEAQGDVARFRELLVQYEKAPAVTKQRLYLETMNHVLPKMGQKIVIDEDAQQFLPLLNLPSTPGNKR
ncbi:MAG: FtsH protease modulator HflK [Verrucomicrobiota bacterium]